jgi:hypothetical protein
MVRPDASPIWVTTHVCWSGGSETPRPRDMQTLVWTIKTRALRLVRRHNRTSQTRTSAPGYFLATYRNARKHGTTPATLDFVGSRLRVNTMRLGYLVRTADGRVDVKVLVEPFGEDVLTEYRNLTKVILHLQPILIAFEAVERNYKTLNNWSDSSVTVAIDNLEHAIVEPSSGLQLMLSAQVFLNNYLASATAYLSILSKHTGKARPHYFEALETLRKDLHHHTFGYRILYDMRNYSQHGGFAFSHASTTADRQSNGTISASARLEADPQLLLSSGYGWSKRVTQDLTEATGVIDILDAASDYHRCLCALLALVLNEERPALATCVDYLRALIRGLDAPQGATLAWFRNEMPPPTTEGEVNLHGDVEYVPFEQMAWILGVANRLSASSGEVRPTEP